jgi:hypothetical protein
MLEVMTGARLRGAGRSIKRSAWGALAVLLFCFSYASVGAQSAETLLVGGEQAGPFRLGASFSTVTGRLGQPPDVFPSASDPGTSTRMYKKQQLAFLVNREEKIIGITVARSDWKTKGGLGVGSSLESFQKALGKGLKRGANDLAFPQYGLAVSHSGGKITTVYVVKKDKLEAAKGDYLLVGGHRVGEMRLGNSAQDMKALLGPPAKTEGAGDSIWVYPDLGIRLAFVKGRLYLIGVTSGDWVTPKGLKVGRPFSEMKKELGKDYRIEKSSVFYDQWGLGARLEGELIVEILIFTPKQSGGQG